MAQGSKLHAAGIQSISRKPLEPERLISIATRLTYFDKVVTTVACFAAAHRALCKNDLVKIDVSYRKLCRQIVAPPPGTNWSLEWHEIFHLWHDRVGQFAALAGVKSSKFARYVARLPHTDALNVY